MRSSFSCLKDSNNSCCLFNSSASIAIGDLIKISRTSNSRGGVYGRLHAARSRTKNNFIRDEITKSFPPFKRYLRLWWLFWEEVGLRASVEDRSKVQARIKKKVFIMVVIVFYFRFGRQDVVIVGHTTMPLSFDGIDRKRFSWSELTKRTRIPMSVHINRTRRPCPARSVRQGTHLIGRRSESTLAEKSWKKDRRRRPPKHMSFFPNWHLTEHRHDLNDWIQSCMLACLICATTLTLMIASIQTYYNKTSITSTRPSDRISYLQDRSLAMTKTASSWIPNFTGEWHFELTYVRLQCCCLVRKDR